ncbi:MAG TPA: hypothetical protein VJZ69_00355 [Clostridia bacterium]|nr:hypothetical protein [Clostridia bacterium]
MIIFFGKGKFDSDTLIKDCLRRYAVLLQDLRLQNDATLTQKEVDSAVIAREGKPHFEHLDLRFSLSHSHGAFLLAFSANEVGVDLELVRNIEHNRFVRLIDCDSTEEFFKKWTTYEALGKYKGLGAHIILGGKEKLENEIRHFLDLGGVFTSIPAFCGYVATVASLPQEIVLIKYD